MKVLVIGPSVTRALGGMAVVIRGIRESELLNREFEIDIFPSYVDGNLALRLGYSVLGYFRFLLCYRKYDLFHINTAEKGSTFRKNFYLKKIKKAGKKAIIHIHGAKYLAFYDCLGDRGKRIVDGFFHRADLVLALSENWRWELESRFHTGTCRTLNNGVDPAEFASADTDVWERRNHFLMMGRLGERKGVYDLIEAMEIALAENPELTLCLAGDGEVERVRALVAQKNLEGHILVHGWAGRQEKLELLKNAGTLVLPSYYEGLPMAVLEGMAAGRAIISTTAGAIPEVVGKENGILLRPGDVPALARALLRCSSDREMLRSMSEKNRERAEQVFSIRRMHEQLAGYYRQVAGGDGQHADGPAKESYEE